MGNSCWDVSLSMYIIESYFEVLQRLGKTDVEIQIARYEHEVHWEDAVALVQDFFGGAQPRIQAMVQRSLETTPRLWR